MNSFTLNSVLRITLPTDIPLHSLLRKILNLRPGSDGRPKLLRPAELIQTPILIPAELNSKGEKYSFRSNFLQIRYNNLCIRVAFLLAKLFLDLDNPDCLDFRASRNKNLK